MAICLYQHIINFLQYGTFDLFSSILLSRFISYSLSRFMVLMQLQYFARLPADMFVLIHVLRSKVARDYILSASSKIIKMTEVGTRASEICGYCKKVVDLTDKWAPLQCQRCGWKYHVTCLESSPPCLYGDKLFEFVCSFCSDDGHEICQRMNLQW